MSLSKSTGISDEKFRPWLRRELARALKAGVFFFLGGLGAVWALNTAVPAFSRGWTDFNYQLSGVALDQHPLALARTFATRLRESEFGWQPLSLSAPFNVSAARQRLRRAYPEIASVINGVPQVPRAMALKQANPAKYEERLAAYMVRYNQIESGRFTRLYDRDDMFSPPNANVRLGLFATKFFGLPDALIYAAGTIISGGFAGITLFTTVLALSALPLWRSRRPARGWLKFIVWPTLASTLVWAAIMIMAVSAALFGEITTNTSALSLFAALPLLYLIAQVPLHLAETLVSIQQAKPAKWDGVERRKPRPPSTNTIPPLGGA